MYLPRNVSFRSINSVNPQLHKQKIILTRIKQHHWCYIRHLSSFFKIFFFLQLQVFSFHWYHSNHYPTKCLWCKFDICPLICVPLCCCVLFFVWCFLDFLCVSPHLKSSSNVQCHYCKCEKGQIHCRHKSHHAYASGFGKANYLHIYKANLYHNLFNIYLKFSGKTYCYGSMEGKTNKRRYFRAKICNFNL